MVILTLVIGFLWSNNIVKKAVSQQGRRPIKPLLALLVNLPAGVFLLYYSYRTDKLFYRYTLLQIYMLLFTKLCICLKCKSAVLYSISICILYLRQLVPSKELPSIRWPWQVVALLLSTLSPASSSCPNTYSIILIFCISLLH